MERVAFLIEENGERLGCLLNPESLVIRRVAGIHPRRSPGGQVTGAGLTDDPLLYTGGGRTELELDLLFDTSLAGSSITSDDIRDLTRPLWELAENARGANRSGHPPIVRFVWGKSWNIPSVVTAVAERLEHFTPGGAPQRSWMRMRLLRVNEPSPPIPTTTTTVTDMPQLIEQLPDELNTLDTTQVYEIKGGGSAEASASNDRLDIIASIYYGDPALWRLVAILNDIADPLHLAPGTLLQLPPITGI